MSEEELRPPSPLIMMSPTTIQRILDAFLPDDDALTTIRMMSEVGDEEIAALTALGTYIEYCKRRERGEDVEVFDVFVAEHLRNKIPRERRRVRELLQALTGISEMEKHRKPTLLERLFGKKEVSGNEG